MKLTLLGFLSIILFACSSPHDNTWEMKLVKEQIDSTLENITFVDQLAKDTFNLETQIKYSKFENKPYKVYHIGKIFDGEMAIISKLYIDTITQKAFRTLEGIDKIIPVKVKK
jgi:hypothetical protein